MTTALYRRYRPDTFEEVIGQDHVTHALQAALSSDRIAHAFLFSGPRGCGKTTSARILARCLNCAEGPTPTPCGKCASCVELASGGPGSLDVMEIDAASNRGVENAKDLRERAEFAPTRDRFRIFILDEAHMVTKEGFNALLKLVEEPPEHVKFIFATTEPDKVMSTIRSRTHHYPFRLVGPDVLVPYLKEVAQQEGVTLEEGVYALLVRAGGGSVRDTLSVMDQLIAGSGGHTSVAQAQALLGYTDAALLERAVDALGSGDGAATFQIVEEVIGAGLEPRRFVEDLLQRLRDLMVCALSRERAADILPEIPEDQLVTMHTQAAAWGPRLLSRQADVIEAALREMSGATAPRLQLELLMARLLVAQQSSLGAAAPSAPDNPVAPAGPAAPSSPLRGEDGGDTSPGGSGQPAATPPPSLSPAQETSGKETAIEAGSLRPAVPAPGVPTTDEVRAQWGRLREIGRFGAALPSMLTGVRAVEPVGDHIYFAMIEVKDVVRFRKWDGEKHLSTVLTEIFERPVSARVIALDDKERLLAGEDVWSPVLPGQAAQTAAGEDAEADRVLQAAELASAPETRGSAAEPPTVRVTPKPAPEVPAQSTSPERVAPSTAPGPEPSVQPPSPAVAEGTAASRSAADAVLDILGGVVVAERIVEDRTAAAEIPPDDSVPPEGYEELDFGDGQ